MTGMIGSLAPERRLRLSSVVGSSAVPIIWGYFREQCFRGFSKGLGLGISAH
jgi:hypothetical protein